MLKTNLGKKFFPDGCPECGGKVLFMPSYEVTGGDGNVYVCENFFNTTPKCDTYVYAHKITKDEGKKDHPIGTLAGKELRLLREQAVRLLYNLWHTRAINQFTEFGYVVEDKKTGDYYKVISKSDDLLFVMDIFSFKSFDVPEKDTKSISSRTKAQIWLADQLGIPFKESKVSIMDKEMCKKAINILAEANRRARELNNQ